jgi:hypothetical protein
MPSALTHKLERVELKQVRPNVFTMKLTSQELSALVAAARLALDAMRDDTAAPPEALDLLGRVLRDYDTARERLRDVDGR